MSTIKRIYRNMLYLSSAEIISKILQFILMVYAARLLDKASFGKFSFAIAFSFIAVIAADLGINVLLIREIARKKNMASKYFINAFILKILFAAVIYVLIVILLNALNYPKDTRYVVYIVWLFSIISAFTDLFYSIFRAFENMFFDALIKILRMIILTAFGLYVLFKYHNVFLFSLVFVLVEIMMVILAGYIAFRLIKIRWNVSIKFMKSIAKKALPFGLAFIFSSVYFYIGSVMLSKFRGDVEVAIYSVAYNLAFAILFVPLVYTNAIYPVMSRYYKTSRENLIFIYKKSFKYLYIVGLPISVGTYFLADRIIVSFYGKQYISSVIVLQIISWYIFLRFINVLLGTILSSIDEQNKRMLSQGSTAIFNIAISIALISKFGYKGAAIAILITEFFLFAVYYWHVSKFLYRYNFIHILLRPLIAVAIMSLFMIYSDFKLLLLIPLSAIIYFAAILILRTLEKDDYEIINKIFKTSNE